MVKISIFPILPILLFLFLLPAFCDRSPDWPKDELPDLVCKKGFLIDCEVDSIEGGFKFNNSNATVLIRSVVKNINRDTNCQIYIRAQHVTFESSHIFGCDIIIEADAGVKLEQSTLSVEGSIQPLPLVKTDRKDIGCSYGGAGGYCGTGIAPDLTRGDYNTPYYDDDLAFGVGCGENSGKAPGKKFFLEEKIC